MPHSLLRAHLRRADRYARRTWSLPRFKLRIRGSDMREGQDMCPTIAIFEKDSTRVLPCRRA
jgi:hypothetical protein